MTSASSKLLATTATLILAATGTVAASAPHSGASGASGAGGNNEITVTTSAAKSDFAAGNSKTKAVTPQAGAPAGYCKQPNPMTTAVNRTMDCYHMPIKIDVKRNGRTVGTASFTVWHEIHLNLKSVKWSEKITVSKAALTGSAGGIITTFHPSCGSGCQVRAGGGLASPFTLNGSAHTGSANHTFTVSAGHPRSSHTRYEFDFKKPGYTSGESAYLGSTYRCDDEDRQYGAGCVYPTRISVEKDWTKLSDMANLPGIGDNIRKVQHAGLHIGYPGSTVPLTRATKAQADQNRREVCGPGVHPQPGDIWWTVDPNDDGTKPSCDEYPFAETTQGGNTYNPPNRSIKWVPLKENRQQGGIIRTFFGRYHVLPGDEFYVQAGA
ncbi:NucA/NucB deoxyribonuclease domain-containing protein [Streptomyces mirabilis]|uniref:NucA/NucB deoxyribonuclease domain-containing protein n=1 Tax=Streptomyces mirabilis TaxID=68239 RepID=UPI0036B0EFD0